jgi:pSer/pThr/pTyr-binding forkhead associated (FHA) protein
MMPCGVRMAFRPITGSTSSPGSGVFPILVFVQGNEQRMMNLDHTPFTVGRKVDKDLVVADPRVSRDHALITSEDGHFCVVDQGSRHGTFVNGERVQRKTLERNDRVEFGVRDVAYVVFNPRHATDNTAREFLSQISGIQLSRTAPIWKDYELRHPNLRWNPAIQEWFCVECGRTSDHLILEDARWELNQRDCSVPVGTPKDTLNKHCSCSLPIVLIPNLHGESWIVRQLKC